MLCNWVSIMNKKIATGNSSLKLLFEVLTKIVQETYVSENRYLFKQSIRGHCVSVFWYVALCTLLSLKWTRHIWKRPRDTIKLPHISILQPINIKVLIILVFHGNNRHSSSNKSYRTGWCNQNMIGHIEGVWEGNMMFS